MDAGIKTYPKQQIAITITLKRRDVSIQLVTTGARRGTNLVKNNPRGHPLSIPWSTQGCLEIPLFQHHRLIGTTFGPVVSWNQLRMAGGPSDVIYNMVCLMKHLKGSTERWFRIDQICPERREMRRSLSFITLSKKKRDEEKKTMTSNDRTNILLEM